METLFGVIHPLIQECLLERVQDIADCKFNLFDKLQFPLEAGRQWFVVVQSVWLIGYLVYILAVLKKTQRTILTFEFAIIFIELIKVRSQSNEVQLILLVFHEFLLVGLISYLVIMILQSQIRAIVCANFIKQYFLLRKQESKIRGYVILSSTILIGFILSTMELLCQRTQ